MLIARFLFRDRIRYGVLEGKTFHLLDDHIYKEIKFTGEHAVYDDVRLLAPVDPGMVIGLGRNYIGHIKEMGMDPPDRPAVFFKPGRSVIGPRDAVVIPDWATRVDYEGELGVVVGKKMRYVPEQSASDYVFGYTCFNDVTERDIGSTGLINQDVSKCCDTFGPCGPWISTHIDPENTGIRTYLNGRVVQDDNTGNTVFSVPKVLSFISSFMTLMPGDLIITGTPGGIGPLSPGDTVEVEIDGVGRLSNPVSVDS